MKFQEALIKIEKVKISKKGIAELVYEIKESDFTKEEIKKLQDASNIDCVNCINCWFCENCNNCEDCYYCDLCADCKSCKSCAACKGCEFRNLESLMIYNQFKINYNQFKIDYNQFKIN
jgi:hypothetical protein